MANQTTELSKLDAAIASLDKRAEDDLRTFCCHYLAHHFTHTDAENEHPEWGVTRGWGTPQIETADTLTGFVMRTAPYNQYTNCIIEIFRGSGKSTIGVVGFILWLVCTRRRNFIILISDTTAQAIDQLAAVLDELENNEHIRETYGVLYEEKRRGTKTERKRQNDVTLTMGARIIARGAGQKLRGTKWKAQRPDCIIMDDPQGEDQAESVDMMEKRCRWIERVVLPMGALNTLFILIATPLRHNDVIARMKSKAATYHVRFPAEDEYGDPTDPFRFPAGRLKYLLEQMGPTTYGQEMKLIPAGDEHKPFKTAWCRRWPEAQTKAEDGQAVIGWDPKAKKKQEGDNFAACGLRMISDCDIIIERCIATRVPMMEQAEIVAMLAVKMQARLIVVETIAAQEWAVDQLTRALREVGHSARIIGQEHYIDKRVFLEKTLQVPIFNGEIQFATNSEMDALIKELGEFPYGANDDRCDALADAYLGTIELRRGLGLTERMRQLEAFLKVK